LNAVVIGDENIHGGIVAKKRGTDKGDNSHCSREYGREENLSDRL
jgi:hypothetical protein